MFLLGNLDMVLEYLYRSLCVMHVARCVCLVDGTENEVQCERGLYVDFEFIDHRLR